MSDFIYNDVEQALNRAFNAPRLHYGGGWIFTAAMYDGVEPLEHIAQDAIVLRIIHDICNPVDYEILRVRFDRSSPDIEITSKVSWVLDKIAPSSTMNRDFATQVIMSMFHVRGIKPVTIVRWAQRLRRPTGTLYRQSSELKKVLQSHIDGAKRLIGDQLAERGLLKRIE